MAGQKRSREELIEDLHHQLAALRASCKGYDAGDVWEGPRIATTVYTLVNDGRSKTVSILTQLGIRSSTDFISYATPNIPGNLVPWAPLCFVRMQGSDCKYMPALDVGPPVQVQRMKFKQWWEEPVFENTKGNLLRMNLTFSLRSQDGGSHFDSELPISPYLEFKETGVGMTYFVGGEEPKRIPNAHLATMRHIAFELEQSLLPFLQESPHC